MEGDDQMVHFILKQLQFVRNNTLTEVSELTEQQVTLIPAGFRNNIKWHLGHIYVVQEKFAFDLAGEAPHYPAHFKEWFDTGSSPSDWKEEMLPTREELLILLKQQILRIDQTLSLHINKQIQPYTTSTGLTLTAVQELLSFCLYHEGMHFGTIKSLKYLL